MNVNSPDLHEGYIMVYRKMKDWGWYKDVNTFKLFMHMLLIANHKSKEWRGITIERGCFVSSTSQLALDSGLSVQMVKTAIKHLETTHEIEKKANSKFSYFKVVNFDLYQGFGHNDNTVPTSSATNNQPTTNQQVTTNNNVNNEIMKIGLYNNVFLSKDDITYLENSFPEVDLRKCIDSFSSFINDNPKYYPHTNKHRNYIAKLITSGKYTFLKEKENDL